MKFSRVTPEVILWPPQAHIHMHLHTHERTLCIYTNVKVPRDLTEGLGGEILEVRGVSWAPFRASPFCGMWLTLVSIVPLKTGHSE